MPIRLETKCPPAFARRRASIAGFLFGNAVQGQDRNSLNTIPLPLQPLGVRRHLLLRALEHSFGTSRHPPSFSCVASSLSDWTLNPTAGAAFAGTPRAN
jgi:hypothetical protein